MVCSESHLRANRNYYYNHKDEIRKKAKDNYLINSENIIKTSIEYYKNNKERIDKRQKEYLLLHPEKNSINRYRNLIKEILNLLSIEGVIKCYKCGYDNDMAIEIDHVNGNGCKERHLTSSYTYYLNILKKVKEGSKDYQLLCCNCGRIKKYLNGEGTKKREQRFVEN